MDALSRGLLETLEGRSATARALMDELERREVIVYVGTALLPENVKGITRFVVATPSVRYLRVLLKLPRTRVDLLQTLGHELQHTLDIARMPEIRDEVTFAAACRRLGHDTHRNGFFETDTALQTGRRVAREIAESGGGIEAAVVAASRTFGTTNRPR